MKNRLLLITLFLSVSLSFERSFAQTWEIVNSFTGNTVPDLSPIEGAITDRDGTSYLTGTFRGKVQVDGKTYDAGTSNALYMMTVAPSGTVIYFHFYNSFAQINKLFLDNAGNLYALGIYEDEISFSADVALKFPIADAQVQFIAKFDSNGEALWARTLGNDRVVVTADGLVCTDMEMPGNLETLEDWNQYMDEKWGGEHVWVYGPDAGLQKIINVGAIDQYQTYWSFLLDGNEVFLITGYSYGEFPRNLFKLDFSTAKMNTIGPIADSFEDFHGIAIHNNKLIFSGIFPEYSEGLHFGDVFVEPLSPGSEWHQDGYVVRYDIDQQKYEWGVGSLPGLNVFGGHYNDRLSNMHVSEEGRVYVRGDNHEEYEGEISLYAISPGGSRLWTKTATVSGAELMAMGGTDECGNLYAIAGVGNSMVFDTNEAIRPASHYAIVLTRVTSVGCQVANEDEEMASENVSIFPNPGTGRFQIEMREQKGAATVSVLNSMGTVVKRLPLTAGESVIDLTEVADGMYIVKVVSGSRITTHKVVKDATAY